jgi:hypothetical protein
MASSVRGVHNCLALRLGFLRSSRRALIEFCLNALFITWVVYFLATGYVVPLLHHEHRVHVEIQQPVPVPDSPLDSPEGSNFG